MPAAAGSRRLKLTAAAMIGSVAALAAIALLAGAANLGRRWRRRLLITELGKQRGVSAVFAGHLKVTNPAASGGIAGILTPRLEATIRTDLMVRLLSAQSGGTVWRSSAWATQKVGGVSVVGGQLNFAARDPKTAYGPMVNTIVNIVTRDMWGTWQKQ